MAATATGDAARRLATKAAADFVERLEALAKDEARRASRYLWGTFGIIALGAIVVLVLTLAVISGLFFSSPDVDHPVNVFRTELQSAEGKIAATTSRQAKLRSDVLAAITRPGAILSPVGTIEGDGRAMRAKLLVDGSVLVVGGCYPTYPSGTRFNLSTDQDPCIWTIVPGDAAPGSYRRVAGIRGSIADFVQLPDGRVFAVVGSASLPVDSELVQLDYTTGVATTVETGLPLRTQLVTIAISGPNSLVIGGSDAILGPFLARVDLGTQPPAVSPIAISSTRGNLVKGEIFHLLSTFPHSPGQVWAVGEAEGDDWNAGWPVAGRIEPTASTVSLTPIEGEYEEDARAFQIADFETVDGRMQFMVGGGESADGEWDYPYLWTGAIENRAMSLSVPDDIYSSLGEPRAFPGGLVSLVEASDRWALAAGWMDMFSRYRAPTLVPVSLNYAPTVGAPQHFDLGSAPVDLLEADGKVLLVLSGGKNVSLYEVVWERGSASYDRLVEKYSASGSYVLSSALASQIGDEKYLETTLPALMLEKERWQALYKAALENSAINANSTIVASLVLSAIVGLFIYLLHVFISLHRYHMRRSAFYESRGRAIEMARDDTGHVSLDDFVSIAEVLALDKMEIGAAVTLPGDALIGAMSKR